MELTSFAAHAAAFLLSVSLKTVLIFAVAGLVRLGLRRASAASRHLLWAVTLVGLLCLPVFCVLLPPLAAPVLPAPVLPAPLQHRAVVADHVPQVQASITSPSRSAATPSTEANFVPAPAASRLSADDNAAANSVSARDLAQKFNASEGKAAPAASTRPVPSLSASKPALSSSVPKLTGAEWLLAIWLIGMTLGLSRMILGLLGAARLVRRSVAVASGPLTEAAEVARRKLGLKTRPSVRDGSLVAVPMTFGILRPIVLVPEGARDWPAERLQAVMLHEMGHIKRRDWVTAMLAEVVCALYWFHPLVWLAARQSRAESEQACDDLVLTSGIPPSEYADHLLEVVRGLTKRRGSLPAVVTMACKHDITARIKTILATSRNRRAVTGRSLMLAMLAAVFVIVPLAAVHPVASAQTEHQEHSSPENPTVTASAPLPHSALMVSLADLADLMAAKSHWEQKLPDGTRVRLLFVGAQDTQYNVIKSWTPDGILQQPDRASLPQPSIYGKHGYQFYYGITFASAKRQNTAMLSYSQAGEQGGISGGVEPWHGGEAVQSNCPVLLPESQTQGTVSVHVATGPKAILIAAPPLTGATRHLPTGETVKVTKAVVKLFREQHHLTQTTEVAVALPSRLVRDMSEYSFYPVDKNGKRINVQHAGSNIPDTTKKIADMAFDFRTSELPISRVKEFRFEYRSSQTATFRDVALKPDVSVTSAAVQSDVPSQSALLPDGTQVRLVQITSVHAENRITPYGPAWSPDGSPSQFRGVSPGEGFVNSPIEMLPGRNRSETYGYGRLDMVTMPRRNLDAGHASFVPHGSGHADITVPLATGPYAAVISGPLDRDTLLKLGHGETAILSKIMVRPPDNNPIGKRLGPAAEVDLILPDRLLQGGELIGYRLDALGVDGKPIRLFGFSGPTVVYHGHGMTRVAFDTRTAELSRLKVTGFRFENRAIHPVIFRNVALQPITSAALTNPLLPTQKDKSDREASLSNLRLIGLALVKYVADHHERFPDAPHWMDQIIPYLVPAQIKGAERQQRIAAVFHDPASPPDQLWSYSFNHALSSLSLYQIDNPNQIVAVFESSRGVRNASDGGQSVPHPGRHYGGSDFLFADGHPKFLRAEDTPLLLAKLNPPVIDSSGNLAYSTHPQNTTGWFSPVNPESRQKIPIQGQAYVRRTMKPLSNTFVIFSQSPKKITVGSVWPSSFTDKAGRFRSTLYPGKNYLMVLENNRFRFVGKTLSYIANGNKGSVSTQGTKGGPLRSAQSDYTIHLSLPRAYALKMSSAPNNASAQDIVSFVPVARSASR